MNNYYCNTDRDAHDEMTRHSHLTAFLLLASTFSGHCPSYNGIEQKANPSHPSHLTQLCSTPIGLLEKVQ